MNQPCEALCPSLASDFHNERISQQIRIQSILSVNSNMYFEVILSEQCSVDSQMKLSACIVQAPGQQRIFFYPLKS